jgi:hypothetical protein
MEPTEGGVQPSATSGAARRRLLQGGVLVPLIVTVGSRPAWAAGYASAMAGYGTKADAVADGGTQSKAQTKRK